MKQPQLPPDLPPAALARAIILLRAQGKDQEADALAQHLPPAHDPLPHLGDLNNPQPLPQPGQPGAASTQNGSQPAGALPRSGVPQPDNPQSAGSLPPKIDKAFEWVPNNLAPSFPTQQLAGTVPSVDEPEHKFCCVYLPLPEPMRSRVLGMAKHIPDIDLAPDGREDTPHVTALYGLHDADPAPVFDVLSHFKPVRLKLGAVSVFPSEEHDVVKIEVESDALRRMNNALRHLKYTSRFRDYKPHVTIAYVRPGLGAIYALHFGRIDDECICPMAVFSDTDKLRHVYPLGRTVTVEKAAMSYLQGDLGGSLVAPACSAGKPLKLKRKRKRLASIRKALSEIGAGEEFTYLDAASPEPEYPADTELFVFGTKAFDETQVNREKTAHDDKRPGEFAPKSEGGDQVDKKKEPPPDADSDWVHAPTPRTRNRYLNRHTGAVRHTTKAPKGRSHGERENHRILRDLRLAQPAKLEDQPDTHKQVAEELGFAPEDLIALGGSMPGTKGKVHYDPTYGKSVVMYYDHPDAIEWTRYVDVQPDGTATLNNASFFLRPSAQGSGFGTTAFANQIRGAIQAGVSKVVTYAGRGKMNGMAMNGYSTWPVLGYDAPLEESQVKRLPPELKKARTVQDLYATPAGKEWWKKHGTTMRMTFDVTPGSRSMRVLNAYLAKHGKLPVEYTDEQHTANIDKQARRHALMQKTALDRVLKRTHDGWERAARASGLDPAVLRQRAEAAASRIVPRHGQTETDVLDAEYLHAHTLMTHERLRANLTVSNMKDWHEALSRWGSQYGLTADDVLRKAYQLAQQDSGILNMPNAHDQRYSAIGSAQVAIQQEAEDRLARLQREHADLREKYADHVESQGVPRHDFYGNLATLGVSHQPSMVERDDRLAANLMFEHTARRVIESHRRRQAYED